MEQEDFYKDQYFTALNKRLDTMEAKLDSINSKVLYIYAFAAGVGFLASFAWSWVQARLFNN